MSGKLHGRPEQRTGKTGKPFVVAKLRAAVGGDEVVFVNVVAFDAGAQAALLALEAGDAVSLAGTLKPGAWTDKTGAARPSLDMVAAQVLTAYGLKRKRERVVAAGEQRQQPPQRRDGPPPTWPQQHQADFPEDDAWLAGGAP